MWSTCLVGKSEDNTAVRNPTHISDRGDAAVVSVVLGTQILQLQNLRFPLQLRRKNNTGMQMCAKI